MKKISDFNSATEKYPVVYAGSATRPEYVDMPTTLQQQEGVAPMDTLPAQWWNAMWKLATKDINAFRDFVGDAFTEINNLLTKFNITLDDADSEQLYDFFHDDYVQNYLSTFFVNVSGDTIDGDLHIKGDLTVDGIGEEVISTKLKVGADTITLRNGNPSGLGNTELAGVVTENYDGLNHNNIIAIDKDGVARTGDIDIATRILYSSDGTHFFEDEELTIAATIGQNEIVRDTGNQTSGDVEIYEGTTFSNDDTEAIATRADASSMSDGYGITWNAQRKRLETTFVPGGAILPQNISADTTISGIAIDKCLYITAASAITLTLANASNVGVKVRIINTTSLTHTLSLTSVSVNIPHILPMANVEIMWNGSAWQNIGGCAVGETFEQKPQCASPFDVYPCSNWIELINNNGAFYRAASAPTTLYTLDGVTFYADVERLNPVNWSGIKNADGTAGTVTDTGNTQYNSRNEQMHIYSGSWTGTGNASAYIDEGGSLTAQSDLIKSHTHGMQHYHYTNISHGHEINDPGHKHDMYGPSYDGTATLPSSWSDGVGIQNYGSLGIGVSATGITVKPFPYADAWMASSGSLQNTNWPWTERLQTDSNNTSATETRPTNFTVKIWKRTA
jgi:hypothetical protein